MKIKEIEIKNIKEQKIKNNEIYEKINNEIVKLCITRRVPHLIAEILVTDTWKELKKLDIEYLTTQLIHAIVNIKLIEYGFECINQENKEEYRFNNSEVPSKLVIAGGNPGVGWYRCIKCNNQVFIVRNRDILHDCTECNGYQFRQV